MRFIILGAGAIGSLLGAYLSKAGNNVILIGREQHVNKINQDGLKIITDKESFVVHVPAVTGLPSIKFQPGDIVFLTIKSQDINDSIDLLLKYCPTDIPIFCFQNGVSTEKIISKKFTNVYGGVAFFSGTYLKPGEVVYTRIDKVGIGVYPNGINETAQKVSDALKKAGFPAFTHESIMSVKWTKLVIVLSMAISAIVGFSGSETLNNKQTRKLVADVTNEGLRVIKAADIKLADAPDRPPMAQHIAMLNSTAEFTPNPVVPEELKHRPSVWQDLASKRGQTEVDYLNGEIVELGKRVNIPTPLNAFYVKLLTEMAGKGELPGAYSVADLEKIIPNI